MDDGTDPADDDSKSESGADPDGIRERSVGDDRIPTAEDSRVSDDTRSSTMDRKETSESTSDSVSDTAEQPDRFVKTRTDDEDDRPSVFSDSSSDDFRSRDEASDRIPIDLGSDSERDDENGEDRDPLAPEPASTPIDPESLSLEHALFVLIGAIAMLLVMVRLTTIVLA